MAQTTPLSSIKSYCNVCGKFTPHFFNNSKVQYECSICYPAPVTSTTDITVEVIEDVTPTPYR